MRVRPPRPARSDYRAVWLRSIAICNNIHQPWHLDVMQAQFIDAEAAALRADFIAHHCGRSGSGVPEAHRFDIIRSAADLMRAHGREPRFDPFWVAPTMWAEHQGKAT